MFYRTGPRQITENAGGLWRNLSPSTPSIFFLHTVPFTSSLLFKERWRKLQITIRWHFVTWLRAWIRPSIANRTRADMEIHRRLLSPHLKIPTSPSWTVARGVTSREAACIAAGIYFWQSSKGKGRKSSASSSGRTSWRPTLVFLSSSPLPRVTKEKKKRNIRLPLCTGAMRRDQARDSSGESVYNMPILLFFRVGSSHRLRHHPLLLLLRLSPDLFYRLSLWFLSFCLLLHVTASLSLSARYDCLFWNSRQIDDGYFTLRVT